MHCAPQESPLQMDFETEKIVHDMNYKYNE